MKRESCPRRRADPVPRNGTQYHCARRRTGAIDYHLLAIAARLAEADFIPDTFASRADTVTNEN
jgi:hypothetical protein